jgi:ribose-phosphate pyrophosphokinase
MSRGGAKFEVFLATTEPSSYLADLLREDLVDQGMVVNMLRIERKQFANRERYYRVDVKSSFELLGKPTMYIASITNDEELLDLYRVGNALAQAGSRRRIFIIPFLAYSTMHRASKVGDVMTAKSNSQMMASLGRLDEGTLFLFLDLHERCLLHYFEGPCFRIELTGWELLKREVSCRWRKGPTLIIGSTSLRHADTVDIFAQELDLPLILMREFPPNFADYGSSKDSFGVMGDVTGKHVLIFDDIIRSGHSIIAAAEEYLRKGATAVDVVVSHIACFNEEQLQAIVNSPIGVVIATNSHPTSQMSIVKNNKQKFVIINAVAIISTTLMELLPHTNAPRFTTF